MNDKIEQFRNWMEGQGIDVAIALKPPDVLLSFRDLPQVYSRAC